jgi:hypothetical protein
MIFFILFGWNSSMYFWDSSVKCIIKELWNIITFDNNFFVGFLARFFVGIYGVLISEVSDCIIGNLVPKSVTISGDSFLFIWCIDWYFFSKLESSIKSTTRPLPFPIIPKWLSLFLFKTRNKLFIKETWHVQFILCRLTEKNIIFLTKDFSSDES